MTTLQNARPEQAAAPAAAAVPAADTTGPLTRDQVVATALTLIDRDGIEALSMRRLAAALGRDPMALYRHAKNKSAILEAVVEMVLAPLSIDATDPDWSRQLRIAAREYRRLVLAHPHVVPLLVTLPASTSLAMRPPGTLRPLESVLALLTGAGFTGADALHIYRAFFGFLYGHVINELQEVVENPEEHDAVLRLGLYRLPLKDFPILRGLASDLAAYDGETELERGLDILLAGLTTTLLPQAHDASTGE